MEELDLKQLFEIFWNKKIQIILIVLIFAVIGGIYTMFFVNPVYTSSTTLVLASQSSDKASSTDVSAITTTDITINSKLVSTYSELVKSKNVIRKVKSNLNIDVDEDDIRKNVSVSALKDTEIIKIAVTNDDPVNASKIANEISKVFIEKVKEIYNIENVQVVDEAETPDSPSNINHKKDVIIFAFIGGVLSVGYVLIANMLDTTIKTAEEIENGFKTTVIASIPVYTPEAEKTITKKVKEKSKGKGGKK